VGPALRKIKRRKIILPSGIGNRHPNAADRPTAGAHLVSLAPSCTAPSAAISSAVSTPLNREING
jgi:hypothetical protein